MVTQKGNTMNTNQKTRVRRPDQNSGAFDEPAVVAESTEELQPVAPEAETTEVADVAETPEAVQTMRPPFSAQGVRVMDADGRVLATCNNPARPGNVRVDHAVHIATALNLYFPK